MMMKGFVVAVLMFATFNVQAAIVNFGDGEFNIVTDVFFNTDVLQSDGVTLVSEGVGQVLTITSNIDGQIYNSGTASSEMNFVFGGLALNSTVEVLGTNVFADILGIVDFYDNTLGTFSATGVFATDSANIATGSALLSGSGHEVAPNNYTVVGTSNATTISGNGALNITGGLLFDSIVQDQLTRGPAGSESLADMTFNFSGDKLSTNGYDWGGSADFASVSAVPVPAAAWLFGTGMLGMLGMTRKRAA